MKLNSAEGGGKDNNKRTINRQITHRIRPILLLLALPLIFPQQPRKMPQHRIALHEDASIKLHDGDSGVGVHLGDLGAFVFRVFGVVVPHVVEGDPRVDPEEPHHLASSPRHEVEVVHRGYAADGFVGRGFLADAVGGGHFGLFFLVLVLVGFILSEALGGSMLEVDREV